MKNGKDSQEGLLIPETNWTAGSEKQEANLSCKPSACGKEKKNKLNIMNMKFEIEYDSFH